MYTGLPACQVDRCTYSSAFDVLKLIVERCKPCLQARNVEKLFHCSTVEFNYTFYSLADGKHDRKKKPFSSLCFFTSSNLPTISGISFNWRMKFTRPSFGGEVPGTMIPFCNFFSHFLTVDEHQRSGYSNLFNESLSSDGTKGRDSVANCE